jgi:hypothetical protein
MVLSGFAVTRLANGAESSAGGCPITYSNDRLQLSLSKTTIYPLEPILATLVFRNNSGQDKSVSAAFRETLEICIRRQAPDSPVVIAKSREYYIGLQLSLNDRLPAGSSWCWDEVLLATGRCWSDPKRFLRPSADARRFLFSEQGKYQVSAELSWFDQNTGSEVRERSNVVELLVEQPWGDDSHASATIARDDVTAYIQTMYWRHLPTEVERRLQPILDCAADAPFHDIVNYILGKHHWAHAEYFSESDARGVSRGDHARKAYSYFAHVGDQSPALRIRAALYQLTLLPGTWRLEENVAFSSLEEDVAQFARGDQVPLPDELQRLRTGGRDWPTRYLRTTKILYVDDPRLDARLSLRVEPGATVSDLFREASRQTGVRLSAAPEILRRPIVHSVNVDSTLREWMYVGDLDRYWEVREEGYHLVLDSNEKDERR